MKSVEYHYDCANELLKKSNSPSYGPNAKMWLVEQAKVHALLAQVVQTVEKT